MILRCCYTLLTLFLANTCVAQSGQFLQLDGMSGFMQISDHNDLDIDLGESFTISCVVRGLATADYYRIIHKRVVGSGTGYQFINKSGSGEFGVNLKSPQGVNAGPPFGSDVILDGNWHHIAMVVNAGNNTSEIYVDGVLNQSNTTVAIGGESFANAVDVFVGTDPDLSTFFPGDIDDIRYWSYAMNGSQVVTDMSAVINGTEPNLIAAWDFENVNGSQVYDLGANGHTGTLNSGAIINNPNAPIAFSQATVTGTTLPVGRANFDERALLVNVQTTGATGSLDLTSLDVTVGTTNLNNIDDIKVYYTGASEMLNTSNLFGSVSPGAGTLSIAGIQSLLSGNNYFWITYDIDANATEGEYIEATCESVNAGGINPLSVTSSGDQRLILLEHNTLFSGGDFNSNSYRIPAVCTAQDGTIITAIDARIDNNSDLPGNIDIVVRRSTDGGHNWLTPQTIADFGADGASDPALVVDRATGDILCLFASHSGLFQSTPSNKIRFQVSKSTDNGATWSAPVEHSTDIYAPNWNAAWVASGSAHQLRNGRIVAVVGVREIGENDIDNFVIYSDDAGDSWSFMATEAVNSGNESKIIELDNGDWMINSRNNATTNRLVTTSTDQGATWGASLPDLIDPGCNADLIRYTSTLDGYNQSRVLFSNLQSTSGRFNIHVYLSHDEASSWTYSKQIYEGASAYSSLTILDDGTVGLYYENGEYENYQISFARFSLDWLSNGDDTYLPAYAGNKENNTMNYKFNLYPNPTEEFVIIQLSGLDANELNTIQLLDVTGKEIKEFSCSGEEISKGFKIDVNELSSGIYYLKIEGYSLAKFIRK